jgi:ribosomal protein S4
VYQVVNLPVEHADRPRRDGLVRGQIYSMTEVESAGLGESKVAYFGHGTLGGSIPQWVEINKDAFEGTVKQLPVRDDITMPIQEQLIVSFETHKIIRTISSDMRKLGIGIYNISINY